MYGFFRLVLILLLVLTSQSLAAARVQPRPVGEMVICAGGAVMTVSVDENGNPVDDVQLCPDMAFNVMAAVAHDAPMTQPLRVAHALAATLPNIRAAGRDAPAAQARDPPPVIV